MDNAFEQEKGTLGLIYTPRVAYVASEKNSKSYDKNF